ncbi:hypothetical protein ACQJBY_057524 [Aegilops geniculata]
MARRLAAPAASYNVIEIRKLYKIMTPTRATGRPGAEAEVWGAEGASPVARTGAARQGGGRADGRPRRGAAGAIRRRWREARCGRAEPTTAWLGRARPRRLGSDADAARDGHGAGGRCHGGI